MKKVDVFIDPHNLYSNAKKRYKKKVNYAKYLEYCELLGNLNNLHAYFLFDRIESSEKFYQSLEKLGFVCHFQKKDRAMSMAIDITKSEADTVVIGSNSKKFLVIDRPKLIVASNIEEGQEIPPSWMF